MDNRRRYDERDHRPHEDDRRHRRFEDEFRFKRGDFDRMRKHVHVMKRPFGAFGKTTTKLMTSKAELVEYVNQLGEQGHHIDIFKIEDDLYKVVVQERRPEPFEFEDPEIDIEIDE